jgi:hypothetical protein
MRYAVAALFLIAAGCTDVAARCDAIAQADPGAVPPADLLWAHQQGEGCQLEARRRYFSIIRETEAMKRHLEEEKIRETLRYGSGGR